MAAAIADDDSARAARHDVESLDGQRVLHPGFYWSKAKYKATKENHIKHTTCSSSPR